MVNNIANNQMPKILLEHLPIHNNVSTLVILMTNLTSGTILLPYKIMYVLINNNVVNL